MPVYQLNESMAFPPVEHAEEEGLLAVGGDLSIERLLQAYADGIFPWFSDGDPILWWSPDPRLVLIPEELRVSHSMKPLLKRGSFRVTFDQDFPAVIRACSRAPRSDQDGTWITEDMLKAYIALHEAGYAHSVEVWSGEELAGGLYGVSLGSAFFGESMFSRESNASKYGFISLVQALKARDFTLIDCQIHTPHLESFGAREIPRFEFCGELAKALQAETLCGNWASTLSP